MHHLVDTLFTAQNALKRHALPSAERQAILQRLRALVPAPVLAHFLRLVERGRPGVTLVRHGVCGGCHLRVASGIVAALANPKDLHLCESCGSYLLLAPEERPAAPECRRVPAEAVAVG